MRVQHVNRWDSTLRLPMQLDRCFPKINLSYQYITTVIDDEIGKINARG